MYNAQLSCYGEEEQFGIALPVVLSVVGSIFGGNPKDANRIATNTRAYQQVMNGGANTTFENQGVTALEFLRIHSVMNDPDGGWATQAATTDAANKYKQALAKLNPGATINPGSITVAPSVSGGTTTQSQPYPAPMPTVNLPLVGNVSSTTLLLGGAALFTVILLTAPRGRR